MEKELTNMKMFRDKRKLNDFLMKMSNKNWDFNQFKVVHIGCLPEKYRWGEDTLVDFYKRINSTREFTQLYLLINILFDIYSNVAIDISDMK